MKENILTTVTLRIPEILDLAVEKMAKDAQVPWMFRERAKPRKPVPDINDWLSQYENQEVQ